MNIIGINLSDTSMEAVEMKRSWMSGSRIVSANRVMLPEAIVHNGIIQEPEKLTQIMSELMQQAKPTPFTSAALAVAVPESQVYSRMMTVGIDKSPAEIQTYLKEQLSSYIPFELAEVVYDYITVHQSDTDHEIMVVAVPRRILESYQAVAKAAGYQLKRIELESISSARTILPEQAKGQSILVLDMGARTTIVSFFSDRRLRFTYNIPVAGDALTARLVKQQGIPEREAETLKCKQGVTDVLVQVLDPVFTQIQESIEYYHKRSHQEKVQQVILIGGTAQLPGIEEYVSKKLGLSCVRGNILPKFFKNSIVQQAIKEDLLFINAVGLAVGALEQSDESSTINFLT